jgi:hypothetical protein
VAAGGSVPSAPREECPLDTEPDPRTELTAAQRIAIALGTAELPHGEDPVDHDATAVDESVGDTPA